MFRNPQFLLVSLIVVMLFFLSPATPTYSSCGDVNGDGLVDIADLVRLMNYCFKNGSPPWNPDTAEVDGYEYLNIRDAVCLVNYVFYDIFIPTCPATNPEYQSRLEQADTLRIPPATLSAGDSLISVPIWYKNSKPIRGIGLQLKINVGEQIPYIDSLVLGAQLSGVSKWITLDNVAGTVNSGFLWISDPDSLVPGSGTLFTLHLSIDPEPSDRRVLIDTLRLAPFNSPMFIQTNTDGALPFFIGLRPDSLPFAPAVNYGTGNGPYSVFCADLDGDADLDLAVADYQDSNVAVLKNNGNGTFQSAGYYNTGTGPRCVFCADIDGDGDVDLITADRNSNTVSVLKNNGDATFQSPVSYGVGLHPVSVFCADLNGDDNLDLAVANVDSNNVSILKNNGDGTFASKVDYPTGKYAFSVFCADLDGDGDLDLAVANNFDNNVSILKNNGDATFQSAVNYAVGNAPRSIFCADLDGDGDLDLATANNAGKSVSILMNHGNGSFDNTVNYGVGSGSYSVFCADLDGDGDLDIITANSFGDNVSVLKNNGRGIFSSAVNYGTGSLSVSVFCADLDGEGDLDLVAADNGADSVSVLLNLFQTPANQPPDPFSLLYPFGNESHQDTTIRLVHFDWQTPVDPNFGDQITYNMFLSTRPDFAPPTTQIYPGLHNSRITDSIPVGQYYWKVEAFDNWGASQWSTQVCRFFNSNDVTDTLRIIAYSPVDLIVTDPIGDSISLWFNTIPSAFYDTTQDYNHDGDKDDIVTIPNRLVGGYQIEVVTEPGGSGPYDLGIRIDGGSMVMLTTGHPSPPPGQVDSFVYSVPWYRNGDANGDWGVDVGDVVYLINYLYKSGPGPEPLGSGDATCDGFVDVGDVVYLINYLFKGGPAPSC